MRVTSLLGLAGLVVVGLISADMWIHPAGTQAAGTAINTLEKQTGNQLLGTPAK